MPTILTLHRHNAFAVDLRQLGLALNSATPALATRIAGWISQQPARRHQSN